MGSPKVVILHLHPAAPAKPPEGQPCNGCGVCCLAEPCPLGSVLTLRASGPCQWLLWDSGLRIYRCGVLAATDPTALPADAARWKRGLWGWLHRAARRWIAAGTACDCSMDDVPPPSRGG